MPRTSPAETPRRKAEVFAACATETSLAAAARAAGVSPEVMKSWKKADPDWYARCKEATHRTRVIADAKEPKDIRWDNLPEQMDFLTFRNTYFRRKNFWYHSDAYGQIEANNRLIMLLPPEHAKTTVWAIEYTTYKLMMNPDLRIVVIQKNQEEAKKIIAAVKDRLTNHEFYQNLGIPIESDPITIYGGKEGFKPEREDGLMWSAQAFYLRGRSMAEKDPSMQAKGATSAILGNRVDLMILDDVQDSKNFTSQGIAALKQWFTHDLMSRTGDVTVKHSKVIVLGSRIGPGDFYEWLTDEYGYSETGEYSEAELPMRWPVTKYPAVLNEETREILAPDLWTWEGLQVKKFEVKDKWWSNWMQVEGQEDGATFKREKLLEARHRDLVIGRRPEQVTDVVVGVDPAISGFAAFVVEGLDRRTSMRYLIDVENRRGMGNWDNVVALGVELAVRYEANDLVVETNNTQGDVFWRFQQACRKQGIRCHSYQTVSSSGAKNEETEFSISSIGALFDADMWVLPYGDLDSTKKVDPFIDQLCNWRPKPAGASSWHLIRDMVMATLFAESRVRDYVRHGHTKRKARPMSMPGFVSGRFTNRIERVEDFTPDELDARRKRRKESSRLRRMGLVALDD